MKRPSKYRAVKTVVDGHTFPSKREAARYSLLKLREKAGEISHLELQAKYEIRINGVLICTYYADFRYFDLVRKNAQGGMGCRVVEDSKGMKTPVYRIKKKLVEALYPGTIIEEV